MGLFSNVLKRVKSGLPQSIEDRRGLGFLRNKVGNDGIGSLMAKPDLEPRGGGFLKRAARNVNQQLRPQPQPNPMLPVMPPSIPTVEPILTNDLPMQGNGLVRDPYGNMVDPNNLPDNMRLETGPRGTTVRFADDYALQPGDPGYKTNDPGRFNRDIVPIRPDLLPPTDDPFLRPRVDAIGGQQLIPQVDKFGRPIPPPPKLPPNEPPIDITNMGQSLYDSYNAGLNNLDPYEQTIRRIARDGRRPIFPQDFGFGPGVRPTEIRGPDGRIIGPAGVTPPDFVRNVENKGPGSLRDRGTIRTMDFQDTDMNGVDDRDQPDFAGPSQEYLDQQERIKQFFNPGTTPPPPQNTNMIAELPPERIAEIGDPIPVAPPAPTTVAANQLTEAPVTDPAPVVEPSPTQTTAAPQVPGETPYAAGVTQIQSGLDPLTEQLLFGLGGQGGFIPGAMRAAEKVFYDDQGQPVVIDEQVAGFSPDQLAAMQMQRQSLGMQDPYLQGAAGAYGSGTQALEEGLQRGRTAAIGALGATRRGVGSLQRGLGESADILRGTVGGYDPSMTERFYDPYEDRVVQQTVKDIMEQGAKADIGARAGDIARGGQSAFGSRARLGAGERQEALGRGLAEAVSGIRSQGFREAQQTGLGEFARQKAAERAASTGLAGLAGQGFGGSQALAGALTGLGGTEQQIGQQRYSGQFGLGSSLQGLGAQAAGASASDIASLYGMGSQQQGMTQAMLDAQRRNMQQRQMTPLLQYQALAPFVGMAPAGQFQTTTQFAPKPSAMQTGIGTGLSAFGALGNLYGNK